jgi:cytidine deaminase
MFFSKELLEKVFNPYREIFPAEQLARFEASTLYLLTTAREIARHAAVSYRGFVVGCAVWAFRTHTEYREERWKVFRGANFKAHVAWSTVCAEQVAVHSARCAGYDRIIGVVVVGEPQQDSESGRVSPTLHPCGKCRRTFESLPEVDQATRIVTAHLEEDGVIEEFTFRQLAAFHRGGEKTEKG